jgi:hypothetical protein
MSILWFDNFKFDNTAGAIDPTTWGSMDAAGNVGVTNTYGKNGFSNNGLDLSITTAGATTHGTYFANKMNVTPSIPKLFTAAGTRTSVVGFSVSQYPQSGSTTAEPPLLADMSVFDNNTTRIAYTPDGSVLAVFHVDSGNNGSLDIYTRTSAGSNSYVFAYNLYNATGVSLATTNNYIKFSNDGTYLALALATTSPQVLMFKKANLTSTTYALLPSALTGTAISGTPNTVHFSPVDNSIVVVTNTTPFIIPYLRSGDSWARQANPATIPNGTGALSTAMGVCTVSGITAGHLVVTTNTSPFIYDYTLTAGVLVYTTTPGAVLALTVTPVDVDINNQTLVVSLPTTPFIKSYNYTANALIPTPAVIPPSAPVTKLSNDGRFLFLGCAATTTPYQPLTYKLVNNAWVNTSNTFPSVGVRIKTPRYSEDDNYFGFCASTGTQFIYTYDNQINVISTMSLNDSGLITANNYGYVGNNARISLTVRDEILNLRYYASAGIVCVGAGLAASEAGFSDANFTNAYIEYGLNTSNQLMIALNNVQTNSATPWFNPSTRGANLTELQSFASSPLSLTFKRDYNTTSGSTLNCYMSDFYFVDSNGLYYNARLGPTVVDSSPLLSDNSKSWNSSTGTTSYQILANNPPDATKYVYTNIDGATDVINVDNTGLTVANTYASRTNVKIKTLSPSTNTISLFNYDIPATGQSVSTAFSNRDSYSELKSTYVAYTAAVLPTASVNRFDVGSLAFTNIPLVGLVSNPNGRSIALTSDGMDVALGIGTAPWFQLFNRNGDQYNVSAQTFPDITGAVSHVTYSPDNKYLAVAMPVLAKITIYTISGGVYTKLTDLALNGGTSIPVTNAKYLKFSASGKFLFFGSNIGTTGSATFAVDSVNNTFTATSSGLGTGVFYSLDSMINQAGVEYIVAGNGNNVVLVYRVDGPTTITLLTGSAASGSIINSLSFAPTSSTAATSIVVDLNTASSRYFSSFTYATNTLAALTASGSSQTSTLFNSFSPIGFVNNPLVIAASSTAIAYAIAVNGAPTNLVTGIGGVTSLFAKDLYINSSKIGYRYNK